jgi:hypothetical protein
MMIGRLGLICRSIWNAAVAAIGLLCIAPLYKKLIGGASSHALDLPDRETWFLYIFMLIVKSTAYISDRPQIVGMKMTLFNV